MTDMTITRWAKYGHDRGYATAPLALGAQRCAHRLAVGRDRQVNP